MNYIRNLREIKKKSYIIYENLEKTQSDESYIRLESSKNGEYLIPILKNGKSCHSKHSHINESARMFNGKEEVVLFCGLGGGFHIEYFLFHFPFKKILICEATYASLKRLLELCDFSNLLSNKNVILLPPIESKDFVQCLVKEYLPILMGNLSIKKLKAWEDYFYQDSDLLDLKINEALDIIKGDLSTQARFGKIWMRNIMLNLKILTQINMKLPKVDNTKKAFILGAGPTLEKAFDELKRKREEYVVFASDASFMPLFNSGIIPDFFISIDPQVACSTHCIFQFSKEIVAIFDISANASLVRQFFNNGNKIIFTIGQHPFAQYIYNFSIFPRLDVSGGTVAIAALNVAFSLGFTKFEYAGLDFAYTNGKPYSKGVYLFQTFQANVSRIKTEETLFCDLMFRSKVEKIKTEDKITYKNKLLDSYRTAFKLVENKDNIWKEEDFTIFEYEVFRKKLEEDLKSSYEKIYFIFLPFLAWKKLHNDGVDIKKDNGYYSVDLVLKKIFML